MLAFSMLVRLVEDLDVELTAMAYVVSATTRSATAPPCRNTRELTYNFKGIFVLGFCPSHPRATSRGWGRSTTSKQTTGRHDFSGRTKSRPCVRMTAPNVNRDAHRPQRRATTYLSDTKDYRDGCAGGHDGQRAGLGIQGWADVLRRVLYDTRGHNTGSFTVDTKWYGLSQPARAAGRLST